MYCKLSKPISLPQLCMLRQILYYCLAFMFVFLLLFVFYPFSARLDQLPCEPSKPIRPDRVGRCAHCAVLSTATLIKPKLPFYSPANWFLFSCKLILALVNIVSNTNKLSWVQISSNINWMMMMIIKHSVGGRASGCIISCYYFVSPWGPAFPHTNKNVKYEIQK